MCQRKSWTKMEDRILKLLYEQRGYKKWSDVAEIMRTQYGILGRNGKQCRERYHNHLDQKISKAEWTAQEDQILLKLHNRLGNRWALIARQITGRTDNCVKNRFYSRFRRSIRNINELIKIFWKKKFKQLKPTFISKIIQITEQFRANQQQNRREVFNICESLKTRLMDFSDSTQEKLKQNQEMLGALFELIKQINQFNRKNKRKGKKKRKEQSEYQEEQNYESDEKSNVKSSRGKRKINKMAAKDKGQVDQDQDIISPVLKTLDIIQSQLQQKTDQNNKKKPVLQKRTEKVDFPNPDETLNKEEHKMIDINLKELQRESPITKKNHFFEECIEELILDKNREGFDVYQFYNEENSVYHHPNFY